MTVSNHETLDGKAIQLAAKNGPLIPHPKSRVGCVLVKDEQIIGKAFIRERESREGHAEVNALARMRKGCHSATAYP